VTGQHDAHVRVWSQDTAALRGRHHVGSQRRLVVPGRRRIGQAVPAQIHRHRPAHRPQPSGNRRPQPPGLTHAVDQQDARSDGRRAWSAPVEEVDPARALPAIGAVHDDHETFGLGGRVGRRRRRRIEDEIGRRRRVHGGLA
jgi:hypothetical protein